MTTPAPLAHRLVAAIDGERSEVAILEALAKALSDYTFDAEHPYTELDTAAEVLAALALQSSLVPRCEACGCTDESGCMVGCSWVARNRCSACPPSAVEGAA